MAKPKNKVETVAELIYWSYANLAMAHTAVDRKQDSYGTFNFVIRAKLFKGLKDGSMKMRSIFYDEKIKLQTGQCCNYCGAQGPLALDHIFSRNFGGQDSGDNLIYACRSCNSSKGKKDLMEWMEHRGQFLPLMIIRRYMKLVFAYSLENDLLDTRLEEAYAMELPFRLDLLPTNYPNPDQLALNSVAGAVPEPVSPPMQLAREVDQITQNLDFKTVVPRKAHKAKLPDKTSAVQGMFDFGNEGSSG